MSRFRCRSVWLVESQHPLPPYPPTTWLPLICGDDWMRECSCFNPALLCYHDRAAMADHSVSFQREFGKGFSRHHIQPVFLFFLFFPPFHPTHRWIYFQTVEEEVSAPDSRGQSARVPRRLISPWPAGAAAEQLRGDRGRQGDPGSAQAAVRRMQGLLLRPHPPPE